jgi:hypothetical protein
VYIAEIAPPQSRYIRTSITISTERTSHFIVRILSNFLVT